MNVLLLFTYSLVVPLETFYDNEDGTNLKLELFDKNENPLKANSWIQLNPETREIYGLYVLYFLFFVF